MKIPRRSDPTRIAEGERKKCLFLSLFIRLAIAAERLFPIAIGADPAQITFGKTGLRGEIPEKIGQGEKAERLFRCRGNDRFRTGAHLFSVGADLRDLRSGFRIAVRRGTVVGQNGKREISLSPDAREIEIAEFTVSDGITRFRRTAERALCADGVALSEFPREVEIAEGDRRLRVPFFRRRAQKFFRVFCLSARKVTLCEPKRIDAVPRAAVQSGRGGL